MDTSDSMSTNVEVIKNLRGSNGDAVSEFLRIKLQELGINQMEGARIDAIYQNERIFQFLKTLVAYGKHAAIDVENIEKRRQQDDKVYGFTGCALNQPMENSDSASSLPEIDIVKDQSEEELWNSIEHCQYIMNTVEKFDEDVHIWGKQLCSLKTDYINISQKLNSREFPRNGSEDLLCSSLEEHKQMEASQKNLLDTIQRKISECSWKQQLKDLSHQLCKVMGIWFKLQAWIHGALHKPADQNKLFSQLHTLFSQYFGYVHHALQILDMTFSVGDRDITALKSDILKDLEAVAGISWSFEKQPEASMLKSNSKQSLIIRLFGLDQKSWDITKGLKYSLLDVNNKPVLSATCLIFGGLMDVSSYNVKLYEEVLHNLDYSNPERTGISVKNVPLILLKRSAHSSACCEEFYRLQFLMDLKLYTVIPLKCCTLPFTLRTGSNQLWQCIGRHTWYCFTGTDLSGKSKLEYPRSLGIPEILTMLQHLLWAQDERNFTREEKEALSTMLQSLDGGKANADSISVEQLVKELAWTLSHFSILLAQLLGSSSLHKNKMPFQDKSKTKDHHKYSFFTWFIAALNTYQCLKEHLSLRNTPVFINKTICNQMLRKCMQNRSAWIRISNNCVDSPDGKKPHAYVVVHIHANRKELVYAEKVEVVKSLPDWLVSLKDDEGALAERLLPHNLPIASLKGYCNEQSKNTEEINHYLTKAKKMPPDIMLSLAHETEVMSLDPNTVIEHEVDPHFSGLHTKISRHCLSPAQVADSPNKLPSDPHSIDFSFVSSDQGIRSPVPYSKEELDRLLSDCLSSQN